MDKQKENNRKVNRKKNPLNEELSKAKKNSHMIAIWRIEDGQVHLYRVTHNFPVADLLTAIDLLEKDLVNEINNAS